MWKKRRISSLCRHIICTVCRREHEMDIDYKEMDSMLPLYVLSNQKRAYGARAILRTDLLQAFAMGAGRNLYILPSSVHELILIPDNGNYSVDDMRETVRTINGKR